MAVFLRFMIYVLLVASSSLMLLTKRGFGLANYSPFAIGTKETSDVQAFLGRLFMPLFTVVFGMVFLSLQMILEPNKTIVFLSVLIGMSTIIGVARLIKYYSMPTENIQVTGLGESIFTYFLNPELKDQYWIFRSGYIIDTLFWILVSTLAFITGFVTICFYVLFALIGFSLLTFVVNAKDFEFKAQKKAEHERDLKRTKFVESLTGKDSKARKTQQRRKKVWEDDDVVTF